MKFNEMEAIKLKGNKCLFTCLFAFLLASLSFAIVELKNEDILLEEKIMRDGYWGNPSTGFYLFKSVEIKDGSLILFLTQSGHQMLSQYKDESYSVAAKLVGKEAITVNYAYWLAGSKKRVSVGKLYFEDSKLMHLQWDAPPFSAQDIESYKMIEDCVLFSSWHEQEMVKQEKFSKYIQGKFNKHSKAKSNNIKSDALWARQIVSEGYDMCGLNFDLKGNLELCLSDTNKGLFVSKYTSARQLLWTKKINDFDERVAKVMMLTTVREAYVDDKDNVYVSGIGIQTNMFPYVAKIDKAGKILWKKQFREMGYAFPYDIIINKGYVYIAGDNFFIKKLNLSGEQIWDISKPRAAKSGVKAIAIDNQENIYATGYYDFKIAGQLTNPLPFIAKYDSSGNELWIKHPKEINVSWSSRDFGNDVVVDELGNLYFTGSMSYNNEGSGDRINPIFISKYDSSGNEIWTKILTDIIEGYVKGIAVDKVGNIFVVGSYTTKVKVTGKDSFTSYADAIILCLDSSGNEMWRQTFGNLYCDSVVVDRSTGDVYISGVATLDDNKDASASVCIIKYPAKKVKDLANQGGN